MSYIEGDIQRRRKRVRGREVEKRRKKSVIGERYRVVKKDMKVELYVEYKDY